MNSGVLTPMYLQPYHVDIFQTLNSDRSNSKSLKFFTTGCRDIEVGKVQFITKTQFFCSYYITSFACNHNFLYKSQPLAAIVHLNFRAGSTFPVLVCTFPSSMYRTSRCLLHRLGQTLCFI